MPDDRPLRGRSIVVTRPQHQAAAMIEQLAALGAEAIALPAIRIQPKPDLTELDAALHSLERYAWLIFTSVNAVHLTIDRCRSLQVDPAQLPRLRLAAIGPATARAIRSYRLQPAFVPGTYVAEQIAAGIPDVSGRHILLPRADGARPALPDGLRGRGAIVDEIRIYDAIRAEPADASLDRLRQGVDVVTFTSPSTALGFHEMVAEAGLDPFQLPADPLIACIGPITASAAAALGYRVGLTAADHTANGLATALAEYFQEANQRVGT